MTKQPDPKPLRLFQSVPNRVYSRLIVRYPYQTDDNYAHSYQFAANRLAETFAGETVDDLILLPYLTLYRQAFELELKNTIRALVKIRMDYLEGRTQELLGAISEDRFKSDFGHNLHKLLNEAKKHYDALDLPQPFSKDVEKLVMMLHEADKTGTTFRYAGQLPDVQEHADFPDLAAMLDEQFSMLSVIEDYVDGLYSAGPTFHELADDYY